MGWKVERARLRNGLSLPYLEQGNPSGIPTVLIHSYASTGREFEPLLPYLSPSIHAYALTFRGHGDADRPETGYAVPDLSDEIAGFMDAVGLESAVIVGSSSGGYIAQWFAGNHPDRTRGLVLVGSPRSFQDKPVLAELKDTILALKDPIDPDFARQFGGGSTFSNVPPAYIEEMVQESCKVPANVWKATYLGLFEADLPSETAHITAPTLLLWGDRDHFILRSDQEALLAAIPGSKLIVYEGVGHIVLWEAPEWVARDLIAFVDGLRRRRV